MGNVALIPIFGLTTILSIVAAAMGLLNRLNDGLRVPLEEPMLEIADGISFAAE